MHAAHIPGESSETMRPASQAKIHCWADVRHNSDAGVDVEEMELEFLLQPRNEAQLPIGPPLVLHVERYRIDCDQQTRVCNAWSWLPPRLTPDLLRRCQLRLRLVN